MSRDLVVRPAHSADADTLVEFNRAMAAESEDKGLDADVLRSGVSYLLEHPDEGFYLVAESTSGGQATTVGALLITFEWSDWRNGRFWWIQSVYVHPDHRRRGVYRSLHAHVRERALSDPQACGVRLYVEKDNHGAQATYANLGMVETAYRLYEEEF